ncbi:MAG: hypothetical protein LJE95_10205 [Acidobacteria bacterium]|jgi:hypothetical protein|nr:hypothetical protein [Acidobacteriota bacterium]
MLRGFLGCILAARTSAGNLELAPLRDGEFMAVARGIAEGEGWPYGHLAFQRVTVAEGDE